MHVEKRLLKTAVYSFLIGFASVTMIGIVLVLAVAVFLILF